MDNKMLLDRIENQEILISDSDETWDGLLEEYPYAAVLQHLNLKRNSNPSAQDVRLASLYKNDDLLFAKLRGPQSTLSKEEPQTSFVDEDVLDEAESPVEVEPPVDEAESQEVEENLEQGTESQDVVVGSGSFFVAAAGATASASSFFVADAKEEIEEQIELEQELPAKEKIEEESAEEPIEEIAEAAEEKIEENASEKEVEEIEEEEEIVEEGIESEEREIAEEKVETPANPNDILHAINALPEQNALDIEAETLPHNKQKVEEVLSSSTESIVEPPKDLMVMMSFLDWLHYFKHKKQDEVEDERGRNAIKAAWQKEKLAQALEDDNDVVPEPIFKQAMASISFEPQFVTESYAELLVKQGKLDNAKEMYRKLSLRNPEKSAYFASKIKELHLSN